MHLCVLAMIHTNSSIFFFFFSVEKVAVLHRSEDWSWEELYRWMHWRLYHESGYVNLYELLSGWCLQWGNSIHLLNTYQLPRSVCCLHGSASDGLKTRQLMMCSCHRHNWKFQKGIYWTIVWGWEDNPNILKVGGVSEVHIFLLLTFNSYFNWVPCGVNLGMNRWKI